MEINRGLTPSVDYNFNKFCQIEQRIGIYFY